MSSSWKLSAGPIGQALLSLTMMTGSASSFTMLWACATSIPTCGLCWRGCATRILQPCGASSPRKKLRASTGPARSRERWKPSRTGAGRKRWWNRACKAALRYQTCQIGCYKTCEKQCARQPLNTFLPWVSAISNFRFWLQLHRYSYLFGAYLHNFAYNPMFTL